jgi:hypothetical protein
MNAITPVAARLPNPPKSDAYAKVRSQTVDAFAALEFAVARLCVRIGLVMSGRAMVGHRLKALKAHEIVSRLKLEGNADAAQLLDSAERLLSERADIVHSCMEIVTVDEGTIALFRNALHLAAQRPDARAYTLADLRKLCAEASATARLLDGASINPVAAATPAFSPPRPSPGAAGGP